MDKIELQLINQDEVLKERTGLETTYIEFHHHYAPGDFYRVIAKKNPCYIIVQLDSAVKPAFIYMSEKIWDYQIPFNDKRESPYAPLAFETRNNYASVRYATKEEVLTYRNLAENSLDQHKENSGFPHVTANAETRNEYVFYCKNAIDGIFANGSHGNYPFESWGTNAQKNAEMTLNYGREVLLDKLVFTLRADYPHDGYWKSLSVEFSDGSIETINLKKTAERQIVTINERKVTWIRLFNLIEDDGPSTFAALTQIETFGRNIIE